MVPRTPRQDEEMALLVESTDYFNEIVAPNTWPAHLPFKRQKVDAQSWRMLPQIMQHLWIVLVRTMQASKNCVDPQSTSDLCYYRGRSLRALSGLLSDLSEAGIDPYGAALFSTLFFMGVDMHLSEVHWSSHLEAARMIINLRGGLGKCFETFPTARGPFISYMMADIMTATMCNVRLLSSSFIRAQWEYLELLPHLEQDLIASGYPCPQSLLHAIVEINILRTSIHHNKTTRDHEDATHYKLATLLRTIESFDAERWAAKVSSFGRIRPERDLDSMSVASIICLTSLAICYKSAALLYLFFSNTTACSTPERARQQQIVRAAKHTLTQHAQLLLSKASQTHNDGPLHTQLWKFITWPLVILSYVCVAWGDEDEPVDISLALLRTIAAAMGRTRLPGPEQLIRRVQKERAIRPQHLPCTWDEGFDSRCTFAL